MVMTKDPAATRRQFLFNGVNSVSADDSETGVYNAYLEFVFHHTMHDAEAYENAAANSRSTRSRHWSRP